MAIALFSCQEDKVRRY